MGIPTHNIAIVFTIIAKDLGFGNCFLRFYRGKNLVEKILYTFSHLCAIIAVQCAGWADPGKIKSPFKGAETEKNAGVFPDFGGSGSKIGKTVACLLCLD